MIKCHSYCIGNKKCVKGVQNAVKNQQGEEIGQ
jgi:hypothetical protein